MQVVGFEQISKKFIEIFVPQKYFLYRKKIVEETIPVAINDSSDLLCFDLYLVCIFAKSTKEKRYTDVMFKLRPDCFSVTVEDLNL